MHFGCGKTQRWLRFDSRASSIIDAKLFALGEHNDFYGWV